MLISLPHGASVQMTVDASWRFKFTNIKARYLGLFDRPALNWHPLYKSTCAIFAFFVRRHVFNLFPNVAHSLRITHAAVRVSRRAQTIPDVLVPIISLLDTAEG